MSFLDRASQTQQTVLLQGGNAPKNAVVRDMLFKPYGSGAVIPRNAPAQNYRAAMPGNKKTTNVQEVFLTAKEHNKQGNVKQGAASWIGARFG